MMTDCCSTLRRSVLTGQSLIFSVYSVRGTEILKNGRHFVVRNRCPLERVELVNVFKRNLLTFLYVTALFRLIENSWLDGKQQKLTWDMANKNHDFVIIFLSDEE